VPEIHIDFCLEDTVTYTPSIQSFDSCFFVKDLRLDLNLRWKGQNPMMWAFHCPLCGFEQLCHRSQGGPQSVCFFCK
jgi:hypothetical protein